VTHGADPGPAAIRVRDTGAGIPRERLPHIFEAFEQGEGGHARPHQGPGLGLALARALCALMNFELMVESEPGRGSTFTVLLPPEAAIPGDRAGRGREAV
jgi:signal transduction histidine kinase